MQKTSHPSNLTRAYMHTVRYHSFRNETTLFPGDDLDDFPDSPGSAPHLSGEAASRLLDADDSTMDTAGAGGDTTAEQDCTGARPKRRLDEGS